mgnify:CR=1 FL=1
MSLINLGVIASDQWQAVHCRTIEEAQRLLDAVREQRPDIDTRTWEPVLVDKKYEDAAFMLSYFGCKRLKFGSVSYLKSQGVEIIPFESLLYSFELPEVEVNQTGILSLLGL